MRQLLIMVVAVLGVSGNLWAACPSADVSGDCRVNLEDIALVAMSWLKCNRLPQSACWE